MCVLCYVLMLGVVNVILLYLHVVAVLAEAYRKPAALQHKI